MDRFKDHIVLLSTLGKMTLNTNQWADGRFRTGVSLRARDVFPQVVVGYEDHDTRSRALAHREQLAAFWISQGWELRTPGMDKEAKWSGAVARNAPVAEAWGPRYTPPTASPTPLAPPARPMRVPAAAPSRSVAPAAPLLSPASEPVHGDSGPIAGDWNDLESLMRGAMHCRECFERGEVKPPFITMAQPRWVPPDYSSQTLHVADWKTGDPTWKDGRGKGLIGAISYLSAAGAVSMSFIPYNAGGDGDNVWPFVTRDDRFHNDVSKLDQWQIVFDHAQHRGLYLHFKLQETENDDNYRGDYRDGRPAAGHSAAALAEQKANPVVESLDGGDLGPERRLYLRKMVARFGYELALNWNLGEENTQSSDQQRAMAAFINGIDPYAHHIVVHTHPHGQDQIYPALLGELPDSPSNDWLAIVRK
jgi:hypothetical protein